MFINAWKVNIGINAWQTSIPFQCLFSVSQSVKIQFTEDGDPSKHGER